MDAILCCRIPLELKQKLLAFRFRNRLKTETQAITQLLQLALYIDTKKESLEDPEVVRYLKENLYNQQIVDWAFSLPEDRLSALLGLLKDAKEMKTRARF